MLIPVLPGHAETIDFSTGLNLGYRQMYNLQFEEARETFRQWQQRYPGDPLGPSSDAAGYLFSELDRLGVLQTELFVNDEKFKNAEKLEPDPIAKLSFENAIAKSKILADRVLKDFPRDTNALFAKVLNNGLRGDYLALIEKRQIASLGYLKDARADAEKLLEIDPSYYDAYLAVGVENYLLGLKPAPMRLLLRIYGAETNKNHGLARLRLTAEKGRFLLPFAKLLLAVAALRDKDQARARELLEGLAREFPNNILYRRELARLQ